MDTESPLRPSRPGGHPAGETACSAPQRARTAHALRLGELLDEDFLRCRVETEDPTVQLSGDLDRSTAG